jgi:nicotinate-nucleotide adenylyltransferase
LVNHQKPTIAIFGGSFDPPHKGHQLIVEKAIETLKIDKLLVVPAYLNPFKTSSLADASTRLSWCHILFDPIECVEVDDYEIKEGKSTVTSQSVKHFSQRYNVKYLIIGSDNLSTLTKWHEFEWLNDTVTWVIATRGDHHLNTDHLKNWELLPIEAPMSSTQIREEKDLQFIDTKIKESVKHILKRQ